jgi:hypothetical protein
LKRNEDALLSAVTYIEQTVSHHSLKEVNNDSLRKTESSAAFIQVLLLAGKLIMTMRENVLYHIVLLFNISHMYILLVIVPQSV